MVHLAAISFIIHQDEQTFYAVNTIGTMNLLAALAKLPSPPCQVLLASSANVYGNAEASPLVEDQFPAPVNHYAMSKLAMEYMARTYADKLPIVIARPFNYTGPGQDKSFVIPKIVGHFANKSPFIELGNLHVEREYNDVRMVCDAYLQLLQHGEVGQTYNVCSGQTYTLQHVIETLSRLSAHKLEVKVNPAFVRANEVHRLCGNPAKLRKLLADRGVTQQQVSLSDTLTWMLSSNQGF
ncbi:nad-dependent epimerase/dehydratase [Hylemonella gracilis ATCC 19624]|uniref:Nad-dependent epimerase/dehydratase n=1 Tax=Hylemonella gracilis ATCC 19624 TaxID=887062 RepID=F3KSE2_9BURK|nr:nad-dependent epimerase/dehydratase [Hylemonella gracilis ATCC 19624]